MKRQTEQLTILYARLSQEDNTNGISNSIENQQMILETYAEEHGFTNCRFMYDDGVTGTTLDRPAFNEVMHLIKSGRVGTLIIKDTSRIGRNYIRVGELIDEILPHYGVRFISINDNADSFYGLDDFMPFRAVMHDHYAKETSKKIRAVKKAKAERGERIGSKPPYGYVKDENRKNKMKPDPYSADIVRRIFGLCIEGRGPKQIAKQLEREQILNPTNYHFNETGTSHKNLNTQKPYRWSQKTVSRIIEDEVYLGHTICMRSGIISYKNHKKIDKPKEEWIVAKNTHEPLVSQEIFDAAQRVRQQKKRIPIGDEKPNILSGMLFCEDCGKTLNVQRYPTAEGKKVTFRCSTNRSYTDECSPHAVGEIPLIGLILDDLKRVTHFARMEEEMFCVHINKKSSAETMREIEKAEKAVVISTKRVTELRLLLKRLYEDNINGRLSDENFDILSSEYNLEQQELKERLPQLETELERLKSSVSDARRFVEKAKKYTDLTVLTSELLRVFIDKIVVGQRAESRDPKSKQDIWIYYQDIGLLDGATKMNDISPPPYDFILLPTGDMVVKTEVEE